MKKTTTLHHACGPIANTAAQPCCDNLITRIKTLRFIPTLMSTDMVRATRNGSKTMTRRIKGLKQVNSEPDQHTFLRMQEYPDGTWRAIFQSDDSDEPGSIKCPYGKAGDILWIRETFQHVDIPGDFTGFVYKIPGGKDWELSNEMWTWKPGIHMPKEACRMFLLIKDIRVERLNSITRQDAAAEGVCWPDNQKPAWVQSHRWPEENFATLWDLINNKGPENKRMPWNRNPWVWVITFEPCDVTFVPDLNKELCARPATKK